MIWRKGMIVIKYIGYDAGEPQRRDHAAIYDMSITNMKKRYPLIDDWALGQAGMCGSHTASGLPLPEKTFLFFLSGIEKT
jgi:hypothetical protein